MGGYFLILQGRGRQFFFIIRKTKKSTLAHSFFSYICSIVVLKLVRKMRFENRFFIFGFEIVIQTTNWKNLIARYTVFKQQLQNCIKGKNSDKNARAKTGKK